MSFAVSGSNISALRCVWWKCSSSVYTCALGTYRTQFMQVQTESAASPLCHRRRTAALIAGGFVWRCVPATLRAKRGVRLLNDSRRLQGEGVCAATGACFVWMAEPYKTILIRWERAAREKESVARPGEAARWHYDPTDEPIKHYLYCRLKNMPE